MGLIHLLTLAVVASLTFKELEAQYLNRGRTMAPSNYEEINLLLTLAKVIEESECSKSSVKASIDVEEIIMKLINALVYTTVQTSCNNAGSKPSGGSGVSGGSGSSGGSGGSVGDLSEEALINLGLLNPNDPDNILKLDLARQKLLGVGLGATN